MLCGAVRNNRKLLRETGGDSAPCQEEVSTAQWPIWKDWPGVSEPPSGLQGRIQHTYLTSTSWGFQLHTGGAENSSIRALRAFPSHSKPRTHSYLQDRRRPTSQSGRWLALGGPRLEKFWVRRLCTCSFLC